MILLLPALFHYKVSLLFWAIVVTAALALLSIMQLLLRKKQPMPVWTFKAMTLCGGAAILDVLLLLGCRVASPSLLPFVAVLLPFLQPAAIGLVALVLQPIDRSLKAKVLNRAKDLRAMHKDILVIGVTGSVGKTTAKELLGHILAPLKAVATPAHVNTEMGIAAWLTNIFQKPDVPPILVVEMGAYKRGEIALLADIAKPSIGVVTAVGTQHLALFGSAENIWRAKSELVESLPPEGHAFLNGDDEGCLRMKAIAPCPVTVTGSGGSADIEATDIEETSKGLQFRVGGTLFSLSMRGTHNVRNVLLAIAVARHLGMTDAVIAQRLQSFSPPSRTFQVRTKNSIEILDDTYNSSPQSFKAAIAWAKSQPVDRKILLAAGLIELGEAFEATHKELGIAAQEVFERVIFIDDESADAFSKGFGQKVEVLGKDTQKIPANSLLVCIGRMTEGTINRLLPDQA